MTTDKETAQNLIDKHPAIQIHEALQTIHENIRPDRVSPVSLIWMTAIGKEVSSFNPAWLNLLELLNRWRKSVEQASNTNETRQRETLNFIQRVFDLICNMNTMTGQQFGSAFDADVMSLLVLTPDGDMEIESPLTKEYLSSIQHQIIDLMNSVRDSSLPAEGEAGPTVRFV